ncbi:unnamed protein product [Adineta steineri]|uniref:Uncharacterized protein n=1 Tax=Adineta steineri TaxID=433720 RepID=A0A815RRS8_9BILA|nr:unnamed protein product [Adineta steineri]CAF1479423.1 unnamed protein product [Adineta steineri]
MHQKNLKDSNLSKDPIHSRLIGENSKKFQTIEQDITIDNENTQILIDTDNDEEFTSSGVSEDEEEDGEEEEEDENMLTENSIEEANLLQPLNQCTHQNNLSNTNQNIHIKETIQINNDHIIAQTMAILASKHRHERSTNSPPTENEILLFIGPCPLYSLASSFGLDMHHGLTHFPCRDVLANGGGHLSARPLWQHLTSLHNLNLSSSCLLISHLILHGYSIPTPIIFNSNHTNNILRTTPRYSLYKICPLTKYGVYGIQFEHGTRLCGGYTCNTNIYSHLISFHKMTHDASLRLSRAIAFNDERFQFEFNEIIVNEYINTSLMKSSRQLRKQSRLISDGCDLMKKKSIKKNPVKKI